MQITFNRKKTEIKVKDVSVIGKFLGLMFRSKKTSNLLFEFNNDNPTIHSYFVFFRFLALWLNEKNEVVDFSFVRPFTFAVRPKKKANKLIEIPFNEDNRKIIDFFVDKGKV